MKIKEKLYQILSLMVIAILLPFTSSSFAFNHSASTVDSLEQKQNSSLICTNDGVFCLEDIDYSYVFNPMSGGFYYPVIEPTYSFKPTSNNHSSIYFRLFKPHGSSAWIQVSGPINTGSPSGNNIQLRWLLPDDGNSGEHYWLQIYDGPGGGVVASPEDATFVLNYYFYGTDETEFSFKLDSIIPDYEKIALKYDLNVGNKDLEQQNSSNYKVYLEIENLITNKKDILEIPYGNNKTFVVDNSKTDIGIYAGMDYNITIYNSTTGPENPETILEKDIKVSTLEATDPSIVIDNLMVYEHSFQLDYTYTKGNPNTNEKGYLEIWNTTTDQKVTLDIAEGTQTLIIDDSLGIDFNPSNNFEINFYATKANGDKVLGSNRTFSLLVSPSLGLEANYDNINNPTQLKLKTYYLEKNDANDVDINISIYNDEGNIIGTVATKIDKEITIDLSNYDSISWIKVDYVWKNNNYTFESIPSIIFDEYVGNGFDLINNPPYK